MNRQFNEAQRQAIGHLDGPCLTLAGPGSGKTTVIVERICRLMEQGIPAGNILVLTFTRAAAAQMRERFLKRSKQLQGNLHSQARQVLFGTFHSAFFQILRYSGGYDAGSVLKTGEKILFLEEVSRGTGIYHDREGWYQEVLKEISDVKGNAMEPEEFQPLSCTAHEFCVLYRGYQGLLEQRKKLDFDDMLLCCLRLFEERPQILAIWQERCQYIMIDEYQDSSRIQCRLVQLLAAPQNNLMVVGDDDQSIYGFRGAAPERLRDFLTVYPEAAQYCLDINYRCRPAVVSAAGRLIRENQNRLPKTIRPVDRPESFGGGPDVTCAEYETLLEENEAIKEQICRYHAAGIAYEDMVVLYRTNRNPAQLVRLLQRQEIPVCVKGSVGGALSHWICEDFCAYLEAALGSTKRAHWLRVVSHPERYYSRSALGQEPVNLDSLFDFYADDDRRLASLDRLSYDMAMLRRIPPYAAISHLRRYMGYDEYLEECDQTGEGSLLELAEQIQETADGCLDTAEWLRYVAEQRAGQRTDRGRLQRADDDTDTDAGVRFMTMHGAKGLEFPVVFLTDANEGITPHKRAACAEEIEEERRLFYVAMTRAGEKLHISWTKERFHRPQSASRFVAEAGLAAESTEEPQGEKKDGRRKKSVERKTDPEGKTGIRRRLH